MKMSAKKTRTVCWCYVILISNNSGISSERRRSTTDHQFYSDEDRAAILASTKQGGNCCSAIDPLLVIQFNETAFTAAAVNAPHQDADGVADPRTIGHVDAAIAAGNAARHVVAPKHIGIGQYLFNTHADLENALDEMTRRFPYLRRTAGRADAGTCFEYWMESQGRQPLLLQHQEHKLVFNI